MKLDVLLHGRLAGTLTNDGGSLAFEYAPGYLGPDRAMALSVHLPLREEPYGQRDSLAFFSNLLPEERQRDSVARGVGISSGNDFALLRRFGGDCAGAVTIVDPDAANGHDESGALELITTERLDELLDQASAIPPIVAAKETRLSLAGAQAKLPVYRDGNDVYLPLDSSLPTTHILKPQHPDFEGLVANEYFCMQLAANCHLSVAQVRKAATSSGAKYLEVRRFDRDPLNGARLHQEDFCQAFGLLPSEKYQSDGGPTLPQCFDLIDRHSAIPAEDKLRLWLAVIFNVLIGNCDAHAKNFSLLYESALPRLAPLYDLVSTIVYPGLADTMAMSLGSARYVDDVHLGDFEQLAGTCDLNVKEASSRTRALAERAVWASHQMAYGDWAGVEWPESPLAMYRSIADGVRSRARRLGVDVRDAQ